MNWRTATVVQLCQSMREAQDYSALPILADALQDADYPDENVLEQLRAPLEPVAAQKFVALIYSDESAEAVEWMANFVRSINYRDYSGISEEDQDSENYDYEKLPKSDTDPHTYEMVMTEVVQEGLSGTFCFGSNAGSEFFYDDNNRREFFRNWTLITGTSVKDEDQERFSFRCAC